MPPEIRTSSQNEVMPETDREKERGIIVPLDDQSSQELESSDTNEYTALRVFPMTLELTTSLIASSLPADLRSIGVVFNPFGPNYLRGNALSCFRKAILTIRRSQNDSTIQSTIDRVVTAIDAAAEKDRCVRFNARHC